MSLAVMKAVAQRNHHFRIMAGDGSSEAAQRGDRVIGWQQHAARGKTRSLLQMQVGDDEQALLFPEQRAGEVGHHGDACDRERPGLSLPSPLRGR